MNSHLKVPSADGLDLSLEIAALGSRSYAFIIDWHFRALLCLAWLLAAWLLMTGAGDQTVADVTFDADDLSRAYTFFLPPFLIYILYHPVLETIMNGRTPGKRFAGVRLVSASGNTPTFTAVLVRNIFRIVDSLPMFYVIGCTACIATRQNVRIGDLAAGTLLVYEDPVAKKDINNAQTLASNSSLMATDQLLLLDILGRWQTLGRNARINIAQSFLSRIDQPAPDNSQEKKLDLELHQQLINLAGGADYEL